MCKEWCKGKWMDVSLDEPRRRLSRHSVGSDRTHGPSSRLSLTWSSYIISLLGRLYSITWPSTKIKLCVAVLFISHEHFKGRPWNLAYLFIYCWVAGSLGRSVGIVRSRTKGHGVCLWNQVHGLFYEPWMADDDRSAVDGMDDWQVIRTNQRNPARVPLWPPHIPHMTCLGFEPGPLRADRPQVSCIQRRGDYEGVHSLNDGLIRKKYAFTRLWFSRLSTLLREEVACSSVISVRYIWQAQKAKLHYSRPVWNQFNNVPPSQKRQCSGKAFVKVNTLNAFVSLWEYGKDCDYMFGEIKLHVSTHLTQWSSG
jgi:hypothetical protein